ncbi:MAG: bifunctional folylpolyglutamate synthase/dihydrofolate synthase [Thermodesulfobacteriota bacterium]
MHKSPAARTPGPSAAITYREAIRRLYALAPLGIRPGLTRIRGLLKALGNPEASYPAVLVAGTNGKGSTAASIASILTESGLVVGLYTSPHLIRFNERIRIGFTPATNGEVAEAYRRVAGAAREVAPLAGEPTFFETATAMAFEIFRQRGVDIAVVEVGMGGRLDATNAARAVVSVITNIGLDHSAHLGCDPERVASEKAGIIKKGGAVVTGEQARPPLDVITGAARRKGSTILRLGADFSMTPLARPGSFDYSGAGVEMKGLSTPLAGAHQLTNAAVAVAVAGALMEMGFPVTPGSIRRGLRGTRWPGRLEVVSKRPLLLLDCAHNPPGAEALASYLAALGRRRLILVAGIMEDKDIDGILTPLLPLAATFIATSPRFPRAAPARRLARIARAHDVRAETRTPVSAALRYALELARPADAVVVAGSIFTVGEAKKALDRLLRR